MNLKIIIVLFSLVFFSSFLIITLQKPLQMDELATHHQIYDKSFEELKSSINTGMNWMPAGYFILLWTIDQFFETNSFTLRFVNLIFITCALLYCKSFLIDYESDNINILAIITIFSHSLDIPFILTEARPYALYFLLSFILIKIYSDLIVIKENKKFYPSLILINFLIPFTFYIGGVYCFLALITFCFIKIKKRNSLFYLILNVLSGWALFFIFSFNTFLKQLSNTFGSVHNSHTNLQDLFTLYGIQVYFPIILLLFIGFCTIFKKENLSDEYNETSEREYFLLLNSIIWALTPLLFFIFGKLTDKSFLQTRYYIPNLASYILLLCVIMKCFLKTYSIKLRFKIPYTIICVLFFLVNSYSLAKSFKSSSPDSALSFLTTKRIPVITCNMRTAFHVNYYYENSSFLLVADNKYSDYLHNFSKHTNPIDLPNFLSGKFVNVSTNKFKEFIFITDNTSKSLNIPNFVKSNNFKIYDEIKLNHPEAHKAYFIRTKL